MALAQGPNTPLLPPVAQSLRWTGELAEVTQLGSKAAEAEPRGQLPGRRVGRAGRGLAPLGHKQEPKWPKPAPLRRRSRGTLFSDTRGPAGLSAGTVGDGSRAGAAGGCGLGPQGADWPRVASRCRGSGTAAPWGASPCWDARDAHETSSSVRTSDLPLGGSLPRGGARGQAPSVCTSGSWETRSDPEARGQWCHGTDGPGTGAPQPHSSTQVPARARRPVPRGPWAALQVLGRPGLRTRTEKHDVTMASFARGSGFEQNSDFAPSWEARVPNPTGTVSGYVQRAGPLYLVNQKALGRSLLGVA